MTERFTYHPFSQSIKDNRTGKRYEGNQKTTNLLNQLNNELEQIPKSIKEVWIE